MFLFTVEFADMTGEGWGKTAAVLARYFLEMRGLGDRIGVESSGTRTDALDEFDAGMVDLRLGELVYSITHGFHLNERLAPAEKFLFGEDLEITEDFVNLLRPRQLEVLDAKQSTSFSPLQLREIARRSIRKLREQERALQTNSIKWFAGDLDERIQSVADAADREPRQTAVSPGRRLILTMTESDLTAVCSLGQDCNSIYDQKGRIIAREGAHRLMRRKYDGLAALVDPEAKNEPVVTARLVYFVEGKPDKFTNPWEIDPIKHLPDSKRLHELVRQTIDGLQFAMRDEQVMKQFRDAPGNNA